MPSLQTRKSVLFLSCVAFALVFCAVLSCRSSSIDDSDVRYYTFEVVNSYPHDPDAFTQGLVFEGGFLYESTGLYGRSTVRKIDIKTGVVLASRNLEKSYFGEGLAIAEDRIFQLTWKEKTCFVYDKNSIILLKSFAYPGQGWGLAYDGKDLIMSDGTGVLRFMDAPTFKEKRRVEVEDRGSQISLLNELEYVEGEIWANIWQKDQIVRISPGTGRVTGWIDLKGLRDIADARDSEAVLNGIAYDAAGGRLFVTGKNWPRLFEIRIIETR